MAADKETTQAIQAAATALAKAAEGATDNGTYVVLIAQAVEHLANAYRAFGG
jgi:hypothetical protein